MLLAPLRPIFIDVPLRALLECRCLHRGRDDFLFLAPGALLRNDVDAGRVPVALDAEPGGVARKPRILERHILERAQAVPSLLALELVTKAPVPGVGAGDDQVEAFAIRVLAGLGFAFDVEWFEFASHAVTSKETVRRTHGPKLRLAS
jgi:hypothetical protein